MSKFLKFDFYCTTHGDFEEFVKPDVHSVKCPICFKMSNRMISAPRLDLGITSDQWARTNAKKVAEDKAFYKEHGVDKKHHSYGS